MQYIIYNDQILESSQWATSHTNRSFRYGDGLFETIIIRNGRICFWADHYERICKGASVLKFTLQPHFNAGYLEKIILALIQKNNIIGDARVRLHLWRSGKGLLTPDTNETEYLITASSFSPKPKVVEKLILYPHAYTSYSVFSQFKTCNYLPYIMASISAKENDADDAILTDNQHNISEATTSNIFWISGHAVFTPSLQTGCVAGVMRKNILRVCESLTIPTHEVLLKTDVFLHTAETVFLTNSAGIQLVRCIHSKEFNINNKLYNRIMEKLKRLY
ncbi:MAG: aminotransferase class IV [Cytophagaceae bacterium]|nr:aminotransferase class IV [Cytophagaceae bacterium]MDW8457348.1 aminotransferase class IV [Cytophagaceae bacterium]